MSVHELIGNIFSKDDFMEFIAEMCREESNGIGDWNNYSIESYLKAICAWVEDMDGYYKNNNIDMDGLSKWRILADILYAARIYE